MAAPKDAFQKIRSRLEKRDIYEKAIEEAKPFLVKVDEDLHNLTPKELESGHLAFTMPPGGLPEGKTDAMGFFHVGPDRFFFNGELNNSLQKIVVPLDVEVFKLQRRKTMRAQVTLDFPITFLVIQIGKEAVFLDAQVIDISGGGVRIFFPKPEDQAKMVEGLPIKGTIRDPAEKSIPFEGVIRHAFTPDPNRPQEKHFGLELTAHGGQSQRMMMLTMEVQRRAIRGY